MMSVSTSLFQAKRLVQKSQNMKRRFHEILDENDLEVIHRVDASFSHVPWRCKAGLNRDLIASRELPEAPEARFQVMAAASKT